MRGELRGMETFEGEGRELLASCVAAAGASGTAAVEAMMLDRFMVVTYSAGIVSRLAWRLLARTGRVSLPNILSGADIYPELISLGATGSAVFEEIVRYLDDPSRRASVHVGLAAARGMMGEPGASDFWAESVLAQAAVGGGTRR
jgi:lipid-A-disaccharide synthase